MNALLFLAVLCTSASMVACSPVFNAPTGSPTSVHETTVTPSTGPRVRIPSEGKAMAVKTAFKRKYGTRMSYARQGRHVEYEALRASGRLNGQQEDHAVFDATRSKRSVVVNSSQIDHWDGWWYGSVGVGNPPQYFSVQFDTGSANFWVMDSSCTTCSGHVLYNSSKSSAYSNSSNHLPMNLGYGNIPGADFTNGFQGADEFTLAGNGSTSLAIMGMPFGQANNCSYKAPELSGILGLGWQALALDNMLNPIMWAMSAGVFQQSLFTAYLETDYANETTYGPDLAGGQITFGALDTTNCGAVQGYAPLTAETYWQFNISMLGIQQTLMQSNAVAISDTGTSMIAGPNAIVDEIAAYVGATWSSSFGTYAVACNAQYPPVSFVINNVYYNVGYKALTIGYSPSNTAQCMFGIGYNGVNAQWILGDPFIRQFCTIYDVGNKRLGFAPTKGM